MLSTRSGAESVEPRCLLTVSAFGTWTDFDASDTDYEFSSWFDDYDDTDEVVITGDWLDDIDSSAINEKFAIDSVSIRAAKHDVASGLADYGDDFGGPEFPQLQIVTLQITSDSGVTLPVDVFAWDGGVDSVLSPEFLSMVEVALNTSLKDVLATGNAMSAADVGLTAGTSTVGSLAAAYGIQPIEIYIDIEQDYASAAGSLYVSGVTVVSEDPLDSEVLIFDEFAFLPEDFTPSAISMPTARSATTADSGPGTTDALDLTANLTDTDSAADSTTSTTFDQADTTDTAEAAVGAATESATSIVVTIALQGDSDRTGTVGEAVAVDENVAARRTTLLEREVRSTDVSADTHHQDDAERFERRAAHSERYRERRESQSAENADDNNTPRRLRLRVRAAETALQIAEAAARSANPAAGVMVAVASPLLPAEWAQHMAAFSQPSLAEQLLALDSSDGQRDATTSQEPTYAQITSATGAVLIGLAAGTRRIQQRRRNRSRLNAVRRQESIRDTENNERISTN